MLRCVSNYKSSLGAWRSGDVVEDDRIEAALMIDSPGSWVQVETTQAIPESDKMVRRGRPAKAVNDE